MRYYLYVAFLLLFIAGAAYAQKSANTTDAMSCAAQVPNGIPSMKPFSILACRTGYLSSVDPKTGQPDWVAWKLTAARAVGCVKRVNQFHYDTQLPSVIGLHVVPEDYAKTGYDLGHMSPFEDNAVTTAMAHDSFDLPTNLSPQAPLLNRQGWKWLEIDTRLWAVQFNEVDVITGPIFGPDPKSIGRHGDHVSVPTSYFKVIYAPMLHQAVAAIMPNKPVSKSAVPSYLVSVSAVEQAAAISLPLPADVDRTHITSLWKLDPAAYRLAKQKACPSAH